MLCVLLSRVPCPPLTLPWLCPAGGSDTEGDGQLRIDEESNGGLEPETLLDEQVSPHDGRPWLVVVGISSGRSGLLGSVAVGRANREGETAAV